MKEMCQSRNSFWNKKSWQLSLATSLLKLLAILFPMASQLDSKYGGFLAGRHRRIAHG
jgi:hypothetical protein